MKMSAMEEIDVSTSVPLKERFKEKKDEVTVQPKMRPLQPRYKASPSKKYGHLKIFQEPACLAEPCGKTFQICEDTLKQLDEVDAPVSVVAMVGLCRSGKSTTLNRLAGMEKGFAVCSTVESMTKGFWIVCQDHPIRHGEVLILLDTEGIGDTDKGDHEYDKWIFLLSSLLCSSFIFCIKEHFDEYSLQKLSFLTEVESSIKVDEGQADNSLLDFFFPDFVLCIQNFTLSLTRRSDITKVRTPDEYLEEGLGITEKIKNKQNKETRLCVRKYFKRRSCYVFPPPSSDVSVIQSLDKLSDNKMKREFVNQMARFVSDIHQHPSKQLKSGQKINGRMFGYLTMNLFGAVKGNCVPCIVKGIEYMVELENERTLANAVRCYKNELHKKMELYQDREILEDIHAQSMQVALDYLTESVVFGEKEIIEKRASMHFEEQLEAFKKKMDEDSAEECKKLLQTLFLPIRRKLQNNQYNISGGYDIFVTDIESLVEQFTNAADATEQNQKLLEEFLEKNIVDASTVQDRKNEEMQKQWRGKGKVGIQYRFEQTQIRKTEAIQMVKSRAEQNQITHLNNIKATFDEFRLLRQAEYERQMRENVPNAKEPKKDGPCKIL